MIMSAGIASTFFCQHQILLITLCLELMKIVADDDTHSTSFRFYFYFMFYATLSFCSRRPINCKFRFFFFIVSHPEAYHHLPAYLAALHLAINSMQYYTTHRHILSVGGSASFIWNQHATKFPNLVKAFDKTEKTALFTGFRVVSTSLSPSPRLSFYRRDPHPNHVNPLFCWGGCELFYTEPKCDNKQLIYNSKRNQNHIDRIQ